MRDYEKQASEIRLIESQASQQRELRRRTEQETDLLEKTNVGAGIEAEIDKTKVGEITRLLNRVLGTGSSAKGILK